MLWRKVDLSDSGLTHLLPPVCCVAGVAAPGRRHSLLVQDIPHARHGAEEAARDTGELYTLYLFMHRFWVHYHGLWIRIFIPTVLREDLGVNK